MMERVPVGAMVVTVPLRRAAPSLRMLSSNRGNCLLYTSRTDVPVVAGSAKPMRKAHVPVPQVHGESGLDGPSLPAPTTQVLDKNFVDFYADILRESSEKVTILAVGPLTNIATLFYCHPELVEKVAAINVMGCLLYTSR